MPSSPLRSLVRNTPYAIGQRSGERGFDSSPAVGEVAVALGKGPQAMHMVRQYDPGVDVEGRLPAHGAHCFAKRVDLRHQQAGAAVTQVHREEIGGTRDPIASVIRHRASMPEDWTLGRAQGAPAALPPAPVAGCAPLHPPYACWKAALDGRFSRKSSFLRRDSGDADSLNFATCRIPSQHPPSIATKVFWPLARMANFGKPLHGPGYGPDS